MCAANMISIPIFAMALYPGDGRCPLAVADSLPLLAWNLRLIIVSSLASVTQTHNDIGKHVTC